MTATGVTTHPLISMRGDATVAEAARLMTDSSVGALGVLDKTKRFAGIFTERDLMWLVSQRKDLDRVALSEVANDFPLIVEGPLTEQEAANRMARAHVRHLIVREGGDLRMFSMRDLLPTSKTKGSAIASWPPLEARDVMSSPVIACRLDAFFEEIVEGLARYEISGMPVVDRAGHGVGVISERDLAHVLGGPLVRMAVRRHGHVQPPRRETVAEMPRSARHARDVMSTPLIGVGPEARIDEISRLMAFHEINRVPVLQEKRLMGIVSRGDVLRAIGGLRRSDRPTVEHHPVIIGGASPATYDPLAPDLIDLSST